MVTIALQFVSYKDLYCIRNQYSSSSADREEGTRDFKTLSGFYQ